MRHFRAYIIITCFFKFCHISIGDPIDFIIDDIYNQIYKTDIKDTFKTNKKLLDVISINKKELYFKLIEKSDPKSRIAEVFVQLCCLTIEKFMDNFVAMPFTLSKDQVCSYWGQIILKINLYRYSLTKKTQTPQVRDSDFSSFVESSMEEASSSDDSWDEDFEDDEFFED